MKTLTLIAFPPYLIGRPFYGAALFLNGKALFHPVRKTGQSLNNCDQIRAHLLKTGRGLYGVLIHIQVAIYLYLQRMNVSFGSAVAPRGVPARIRRIARHRVAQIPERSLYKAGQAIVTTGAETVPKDNIRQWSLALAT